MCVYLCKVDGSARRQVVHFIECLYRPPVTRVGVGETADRGRSELLLLLSDAGRPYLFVTKGHGTKRRRSTTFPSVVDYCKGGDKKTGQPYQRDSSKLWTVCRWTMRKQIT